MVHKHHPQRQHPTLAHPVKTFDSKTQDSGETRPRGPDLLKSLPWLPALLSSALAAMPVQCSSYRALVPVPCSHQCLPSNQPCIMFGAAMRETETETWPCVLAGSVQALACFPSRTVLRVLRMPDAAIRCCRRPPGPWCGTGSRVLYSLIETSPL